MGRKLNSITGLLVLSAAVTGCGQKQTKPSEIIGIQTNENIYEALENTKYQEIDKILGNYLGKDIIFFRVGEHEKIKLIRDKNKKYYIPERITISNFIDRIKNSPKNDIIIPKETEEQEETIEEDGISEEEDEDQIDDDDKKVDDEAIDDEEVDDKFPYVDLEKRNLKESVIHDFNNISQNVGYYFGFKHFHKYIKNSEENNITSQTHINELPENLKIRYILPELTEYFPTKLEDFTKQNPELQGQVSPEEEIVIIQKDNNGYGIIGYYNNQELKITSYVSLGEDGYETPNGLFETTYYRKQKRVSNSYENFPMPYSIQLRIEGENQKGYPYFIHAGPVDGTERTKGCIRLPGFIAKKLFSESSPVFNVYINI